MRKEVKRGCLIVFLLLAAVVAYPVYFVFSVQYYYGEAEPLGGLVHGMAGVLYLLEEEGKPLPQTLSEFLALMPEEDRKRFEGYQMSWNPGADPLFKMRVNRKYGFTLSRDRFLWITKPEELDALFPTS